MRGKRRNPIDDGASWGEHGPEAFEREMAVRQAFVDSLLDLDVEPPLPNKETLLEIAEDAISSSMNPRLWGSPNRVPQYLMHAPNMVVIEIRRVCKRLRDCRDTLLDLETDIEKRLRKNWPSGELEWDAYGIGWSSNYGVVMLTGDIGDDMSLLLRANDAPARDQYGVDLAVHLAERMDVHLSLLTEIVSGMSDYLWMSARADYEEEGGEDPDEETPPSADQAGISLAVAIAVANQKTPDQLLVDALRADGRLHVDREALWEASSGIGADFGEYLAAQSLGQGISWFDNHAYFPLKLPSIEAYTDDGESLNFSIFSHARSAR